MTQRTCNIIRICKHTDKDKLSQIAQYMSDECYCPIEVYTDSIIDQIMLDALYDYIDGCQTPSAFLRTMKEISDRHNITSNAKLIADTFSLVRVKDSGNCINGFTEELLKNSEHLVCKNEESEEHSMNDIYDLETCLQALGADTPFYDDGTLTNDGQAAYDKLINLLHLMEGFSVISNLNIDKLDEILDEMPEEFSSDS